MRTHLDKLDYKLKRARIASKAQAAREARAKEEEARKKQEEETFAKLRRQQVRAPLSPPPPLSPLLFRL